MRTLLIAAATLAPAAAFAQAPAQTGNAVADAFLTALDAGYDGVAAGSVTDAGGATVLSDVTATSATGGTLTLGSVRIENGAAAAGGLTADTITYEDLAEAETGIAGEPGQESKIATMVVSGAQLGGTAGAGGATAGPGLLAGTFDNVTLENAAVSSGGSPFNFASAKVALEGSSGSGRSLDFELSDLTLVADQMEGGANMRELGYDELVIDVAATGSWDPAGALAVNNVTVAGADAGTLTLSLGADGVTEETITSLAAAAGDFAAILGQTQAINVKSLIISYDDQGLVPKLLDSQAATMGVDRAALVSQSVAAVSAGLGSLNMPEFAATVSDAVNTFLTSPGTLTISAEPATAVPLAQVIGGAMMAPQSLPSLLNLKISATQ